MFDSIPEALQAMRYSELLAVVTGLLYILFAARGSIWCWLFGFISSSLWAYAALVHFKLYADFFLQLVYVAAAVYGWLVWNRHRQQQKDIIKVSTMKWTDHLFIIGAGTVLSVISTLLLIRFTDAQMPWLDTFTTVFSLLTTWLIIQRKIENWIYWIVIDIVYIYLYYERGGYLFMLLFIVYTLLAVAGYLNWRKQFRQQHIV